MALTRVAFLNADDPTDPTTTRRPLRLPRVPQTHASELQLIFLQLLQDSLALLGPPGQANHEDVLTRIAQGKATSRRECTGIEEHPCSLT